MTGIWNEPAEIVGIAQSSMSKYVAAFNGEELGLIYSYALSPEEDLAAELRAAQKCLGKDPETQALFAGTAEKLEQVPQGERRRLVADVYATWKARHMEDLKGRQQTRDRLSLYESRQPSMQEQLDTATAEAGERNAECQTVPAAALDAER